MFKKFAATLALLAPVYAFAAIPISMDCSISAREFFTPLVQGDLISRKPYHVESNSINHFKPKFLKPLTVYGMPVTDVAGFANEPLMFINNGMAPSDMDLYGVVVKEGIANVQAQLNSVGANLARTFRVDAQSTLIVCRGAS